MFVFTCYLGDLETQKHSVFSCITEMSLTACLRLWVVSLLVFFQVAGVREPLGAEGALVRSLPSVDVLVDLQVPELGELFAADAAAVRSLSCVSPEVGL